MIGNLIFGFHPRNGRLGMEILNPPPPTSRKEN